MRKFTLILIIFIFVSAVYSAANFMLKSPHQYTLSQNKPNFVNNVKIIEEVLLALEDITSTTTELENHVDVVSELTAEEVRHIELLKTWIHDCGKVLYEDMKRVFPHYATEQKAVTICSSAFKYSLDIGFFYSMLAAESRFHDDPLHHSSFSDKYLKTPLGVGGVIWEWWSEHLKENDIAYTRDDLRHPTVNIQASAYILSYYMKYPRKKINTDNRLINARVSYKGDDADLKFIFKHANRVNSKLEESLPLAFFKELENNRTK